jgi:hypothetical protein
LYSKLPLPAGEGWGEEEAYIAANNLSTVIARRNDVAITLHGKDAQLWKER